MGGLRKTIQPAQFGPQTACNDPNGPEMTQSGAKPVPGNAPSKALADPLSVTNGAWVERFGPYGAQQGVLCGPRWAVSSHFASGNPNSWAKNHRLAVSRVQGRNGSTEGTFQGCSPSLSVVSTS